MNNKNTSLLENELRQRSIDVMACFEANQSGYQPISFQSSETKTIETMVSETFNQLKRNCDIVEGTTGLVDVTNQRIAVLFSGGPAAGGHNVIAGLKAVLGDGHCLFGVKSGPKGLLEGDLFELTNDSVSTIKNLGGFDFLGSDRTKIKTEEQFAKVKKTVLDYQLDGIIIIGGDDSNTNAAMLAEYLFDVNCSVVGVPKTIDGDLRVNGLLPISFGFDTATKIYAEMVGNILQDTPSSQKYWHFVKLMGRSASHVTLEVALQTKPAVSFISEEVKSSNKTLSQLVDYIVDAIVIRHQQGMNYGVVLIPEGLIEFIPAMTQLISELNDQVGHVDTSLPLNDRLNALKAHLSSESFSNLSSLPAFIQEELLAERDSHGNLKVSQIPTELLLMEMVNVRLSNQHPEIPFAANPHFFGYEGRCGAPSCFDASYTYNLGLIAGSLVLNKFTGYMAAIDHFQGVPRALGIPLTTLIVSERRHNKDELVIEKALVKLDSPSFKYFSQNRQEWMKSDCFNSPGPRQFWGPISKQLPISIAMDLGYDDLIYSF
ncbi:diphosphate--fructose-6-phosphate 1-phosphotransferase [Candidatus Marinamargulisbacteria bacterium SCGC AG-410-N11]|nr:diphosphate--fructose-6-phosphate 1-phosphotransferase [Candidatus Marinamargulisbacteria bacterium SCGC AG-410-N11]